MKIPEKIENFHTLTGQIDTGLSYAAHCEVFYAELSEYIASMPSVTCECEPMRISFKHRENVTFQEKLGRLFYKGAFSPYVDRLQYFSTGHIEREDDSDALIIKYELKIIAFLLPCLLGLTLMASFAVFVHGIELPGVIFLVVTLTPLYIWLCFAMRRRHKKDFRVLVKKIVRIMENEACSQGTVL